ncbi:MAG TPA: Gfo/Idh/MocA family oxidoreductase [Bacteroidales bacterium]|nr:Gfo/Idh/MocA family oxidoreductase [Bacteroidales bacterium]
MQNEVLNKVKSELAFIGIGWIGLNRMKSILDADICYPVGIFEPDENNAMKAYELAPDAILYRDLDEMLDSQPDGIVIATPSALHANLSIKAIQKGIAVFCQKPLGRNAEETRKVISSAYVSNRLLGLDLSYRYTDGIQKIHDKYRKEIGHIYAVDLVFNNAYGPDKAWFYNPALSGGGCLIDLGVHLIDLALWMLDFPEITKVSSTLMSKGVIIECDQNIVEDYVSAQFETGTGVLVRLVCSWNLPAGQDAEIKASFYGTGGSALFYNVNGSFYDFETAISHGTSREIVSRPPDDWGGKALINWAKELQESRSFRKSAFLYYNTAEVIDRIYGRNLALKPVWDEDTSHN